MTCPRDIVYLTPIHNRMTDSQYKDINTFVTRTHSYYTLGPEATTVARVECTHMAKVIHTYQDNRKKLMVSSLLKENISFCDSFNISKCFGFAITYIINRTMYEICAE